MSWAQDFDLDAAEVRHADIDARADLIMVDGEHTTAAAFSDVMSLLPIVSEDAVISFHDAKLVADESAILNASSHMPGSSCNNVASDSVCAIESRGMADAIAAKLGPHAHDRKRFLRNARQQVWKHRRKRCAGATSAHAKNSTSPRRLAPRCNWSLNRRFTGIGCVQMTTTRKRDQTLLPGETSMKAKKGATVRAGIAAGEGFLERLGAQAGPAGEFHIGPARLLYVAMRTSEASQKERPTHFQVREPRPFEALGEACAAHPSAPRSAR